nr:hypothetical protein [Tanacetum cinerariifolium]
METLKPLLKDEDGQETVVANFTTEAEYVAALSCYGQCKKQTVVANSTTEPEYVAALSCYGQ